jgi:hypothetical protein
VGTRGGGTLAGLVRGSVARDLLDTAACDVLILPARVRPHDVGTTTAPAAIGTGVG